MDDIADPTDWLNTPLAPFADLENALHCQICKEFYDTPMITSCNHTFCSKCIRTSLSQDGRCPGCRSNDQAGKLRNNWALEEVVATFRAARTPALEVARKEQDEKDNVQAGRRPGKRKRYNVESDSAAEAMATDADRARRKSRRIAASQSSQPDVVDLIDTDVEDCGYPERETQHGQPADGMVQCPLGCGKRMKEEQVFGHLDRCEDEKKEQTKRDRQSRAASRDSAVSKTQSRQGARPQERISELNYSLLKENAMSKKLRELGIPTWGSKQLMVKRHTEWVNLWNANCDSNQPRSKRELLQDLDTWERTQGGKAPQVNGLANGVMKKDFDGTGWANRNKDEFSRLIADARRKKSSPAEDRNEADAKKDAKSDDTEDLSGVAGMDTDGGQESEVNPAHDLIIADRMSSNEETPKPYADNPEAISSVREKIKAANAGEHIEPVINAGFENASIDPNAASNAAASGSNSNSVEPQPGTSNPALLEQSHFGVVHTGSVDRHVSNSSGDGPCDVASHVHSPSTRRIPMFEMPGNPMTDVDGGPAT